MFKLRRLKNQKISIILFVQILFYTFPLSFILGNAAVSLNCILFIISGLFLIKSNKLDVRFGIIFWIFFIFLLYFFINTLIQFSFPGLIWIDYVPTAIEAYGEFSIQKWMSVNGNPTLKTFFLFRLLLLIFIIDCLFFNKVINLKIFFLSSFVCTLFVSFDIIFQYIFGTDLFGYKKQGAWSSGLFGDEKIATTYLKNFSFISFFYFFELMKDKKYNKVIFILFVTFYLIASLLGGNRMPMLLLVTGCVLVVIFIPRLRLLMSLSLILFLIFFSLIVNNDKYFKITYTGFINDLNITKLFKGDKDKKVNGESVTREGKDISNKKSDKISLLRNSSHNRVFWTAILIWKEQPLTGLGFKSHRLKCSEFLANDIINKRNNNEPQKITCSNHAHNYYLEILAESGILGLSCFLVLFFILIKNSVIFLKKYLRNNNQNKFFVIPLIIILFLEIWPIQSTGSFFTSWGATFFWLNIGLLIPNIIKKKQY